MAPANTSIFQEYRDGFTMLPGGMHGGLRPTLVPKGQCSRGINVSFRGGYARTRPGWTPVVDMKIGGLTPFQGAARWRTPAAEYIVSVFNGTTFFFDVASGAVNSIASVFSPGKQVFMTQASDLLVAGDGDKSVAFDLVAGVPTKVYPGATDDPNKMVPASIMHFCLGRIHYVPTKLGVAPDAALSYSRYFISGDILLPGSPMTALGTTEVQSLDGGYARGLPDELGPIRGLVSAQNPGKGIGLGPLLVFARDGVASFDVSLPRASVVNPDGTIVSQGWSGSAIGSVLEYGTGTDSPWSLTPAGTDVYFRGRDGIYSLARDTQSTQQGAVEAAPLSFEVQRWLDPETQLAGISGAAADRRIHMTAISDGSDGYLGMLSLDTEITNSLGQSSAPAWDGIWTGPRFAKILEANRQGDPTLYAVLTDGTIFRLDDTADTDGGTEITSQLVSRAMFSDPAQIDPYKQLQRVDLWLSDITRDTTIKVYFRPDGYQLWTQIGCERSLKVDPANSFPQERRRLRFACRDGMDSPENDRRPGMNSGTLRHAFTYQIKVVWTGFGTLTRLDCVANQVAEENPSQALEDPSSTNFAITASDTHFADVDFIQQPPGAGLDTGWVRGPTKVGNTIWDTGVGIPDSAWPPKYTRQVFPAGPQGLPGATIVLKSRGTAGSGDAGLDVFGDADAKAPTGYSVDTKLVANGNRELGIYAFRNPPTFPIGMSFIQLVGRDAHLGVNPGYKSSIYQFSSSPTARVVMDDTGFHVEVAQTKVAVGDADVGGATRKSVETVAGSSAPAQLGIYGFTGTAAAVDTNSLLLVRNGTGGTYNSAVTGLIAGTGMEVARGAAGFTLNNTMAANLAGGSTGTVASGAVIPVWTLVGGVPTIVYQTLPTWNFFGPTPDSGMPTPASKSLAIQVDNSLGIYGIKGGAGAFVTGDSMLAVKNASTTPETVVRAMTGTKYQVFQMMDNGSGGVKPGFDWVRFSV